MERQAAPNGGLGPGCGSLLGPGGPADHGCVTEPGRSRPRGTIPSGLAAFFSSTELCAVCGAATADGRGHPLTRGERF